MDRWLAAALALGAAVVFVYLGAALKNKHRPELSNAARVFFAAVLVQAGVKIAYLAIATESRNLQPFKGEDRLYIVIGAFVMLWVATADIFRELKVVCAAVVVPRDVPPSATAADADSA